ncbi:MAG: hypothetical protein HFE72_11305 [Emergencia sp.]|nr:hypothetical protein [Emergencia sp.]
MKNMMLAMSVLLFIFTIFGYQQQCNYILRTKAYLSEISAEAAFAGQCALKQGASKLSAKSAAVSVIEKNLRQKSEQAKWHIECSKTAAGDYRVTVLLQFEDLRVSTVSRRVGAGSGAE